MLYLPHCGRSSVFLWPSQVLSLAKFTFSDLGIWLSHQNKFIFDGFQIGNGPEQWLVQKIIKKNPTISMCSLREPSQTVVTLHPSVARAMSLLVSLQVCSLIAVRGFSSRRRDVRVKFWSIKFNNNNNNKISVRCQEKVAAVCMFEEVHHLADYLRVDRKCSWCHDGHLSQFLDPLQLKVLSCLLISLLLWLHLETFSTVRSFCHQHGHLQMWRALMAPLPACSQWPTAVNTHPSFSVTPRDTLRELL